MRNDLRHINHEGTVLNLNDKVRYFLARSPHSVRGIYGIPTEAVFATIPRKLPVGIYQANNLIMRGIEFELTIRGCNAAELTDNIKTLWDHLWVDVRDDEQGILEYEAWNYNIRRIECAVMAGAQGVDEWLGQLVDVESAGRISINLNCGDPTFYDPPQKTASGAFNPAITIPNFSFETGGTGGNFNGGAEIDDGISDTFTNYTVVSDDPNGDLCEATATAQAGAVAVKMTRGTGARPRITSDNIAAVAGETITFTFWTRGDGADAGRYLVFDVTNGVDIIASTSTGVAGVVYTQVSVDFTVPAGCTQIYFRFLSSTVLASVVYFDVAAMVRVIVGVSCTNSGNADAYPTIVYATDGVNVLSEPKVEDSYGNELEIDSTTDVAINQTLTLVSDPQDMSITYSVAPTNWFGRRQSANEMPLIAPGTNLLLFSASNAAANATITITWFDRYASHG